MAEQRDYEIVVGFDGSAGSERALAWAIDLLRLRGGRLRVVRAWTPGEFGTDEEQAAIAQKALDEGVAAALGDREGMTVATVARHGHAAKVLLDEATGADMLVVGSRGHGGFAGLILGSVSQHVATHPGPPVVVIVRS